MDEEFESFVVTNPDLVDEGIDVSGLRTTTDTSPFLLGNIPDSPGIQYSTLAPTKYTDLMRFYSEGLPTTATDTAQIPGAVDTLVDVGSGDGGQATATTTAPISTPITTDITSDQIDEVALTGGQPITGGITGDPIEIGIPDNESGYIDPLITQAGAPVVSQQLQDQGPTTIEGPLSQVQVPGLDYSQADIDAERLANYKNLPQEQQDPGFWETARDNFIQTGQDVGNFFKDLGSQGLDIGKLAGTTILNLAGKALTGIPLLGTAASLIGGALPPRDPRQTALEEFYDVENGTIQSGLMKGYNPVSGSDTLNNLTGGFLPELTFGLQDAYQDRIDTIEDTLATKYPDGNYSETELDERLAELKDLKAREKDLLDAVVTGAPQEDIGATDTISDLEIATGIQAADDDSGSEMLDTTPTNITTNITSDQIDEFDTTPVTDPDTTTVLGRKVSDGTTMADMTDDVDLDDFDTTPQAPSSPPTGTNRPGGDNRDDSRPTPSKPTSSGDNRDDSSKSDNRSSSPARGGGADMGSVSTGGPPSQSSGLGNYQVQSSGGGGGGGGQDAGKSKIVCSMMNESYGFGSFRNKIWLRHSKNLALEYQKGYHKIFLPLVKIAKTNKVVRKILEHIAVHRTIDIRQESRGKMHLLGRLYRKIFEPLCYIVGKYAK